MKTILTSTILAISLVASHAQNLVQRVSIHLTGTDPDTGKAFSVSTRDIIRYFVGQDVAGGQLELVTPAGNPPGTVGNLGAWLRVTQKGQTIMDITSPDEFNLYQDTATLRTHGNSISAEAINRFSIGTGDLPFCELQGYSRWRISTRPVQGVDTSSAGAFSSNVNGIISITDGPQYAPVRGSVIAGSPKPE